MKSSSLASFPKTFGLTELKKGYFPHYFNKPCNQNYIGPMPSKKHYGYDSMSTNRRTAFLKWYEDRINENYIFNIKDELRSYCRSDVDILRRSMLKFREDFIKLENINPLQYITIPSVCMTICRSNYMPEYTIGVHKEVYNETQSKIAYNWLRWLETTESIKIKHAFNGPELNIKDIGKVDGYCKKNKYCLRISWLLLAWM